MTTVNTKHSERRTLRFETLSEIAADARTIAEADRAGTLRRTGNWSAGQNFDHVGKVMLWSIDGFPARLPLPMRVIGRLLRNGALTKTMRAGFTLSGSSSFLMPDTVSTDAGLELLTTQADRVEAGERCTQPSPLFGALTHDQWVQLHCRHAELHLSFLHTS